MKKMRLILIGLASAVLCSSAVSCKKDYVGKEKTHPTFTAAGVAQESGKYEEAAKLYEEFLLVAPKSAETHKKLAALYGDNLDSPLKAIYHYEKVLELKPDDPDSESYRSFIGVSKKKLFALLKKDFHDEEKENALKTELEKTQVLLQKYKVYSKQILDLHKEREKQWRAYRDRVERRFKAAESAPTVVHIGKKTPPAPAPAAGKPVKKETGKSVSGTPAPAPGTPAAGEKAAPSGQKILGKHTVKKGETLHSIARKYYGSTRYYKLIAEANKGKLPANLAVRVGQELVIPQKPAK